MKGLETIGLTFVLVALATVHSVEAQEDRLTPKVAVRDADTVLQQTTPFVLVNLARQGYFENFPNQVSLLRADAADLVEAGIEQGKVAPQTLNDSGYLNAVETHLRTITNSR